MGKLLQVLPQRLEENKLWPVARKGDWDVMIRMQGTCEENELHGRKLNH
jgi:hypothetical protein